MSDSRAKRLLGDRLDGPRVRLEAIGESEYAVVRTEDGERLGRVVLALEGNVLSIRELCIDPAHRGYGAGSGAASLIREAWARHRRWTTLRAFAPPGSGLAVYYWMRMGLRPVPGEGPEGGLLLEREKSSAPSAAPR